MFFKAYSEDYELHRETMSAGMKAICGMGTYYLCSKCESEIREIVNGVIGYSVEHGGFALGSVNSIPEYVPTEGYLAMVETARVCR